MSSVYVIVLVLCKFTRIKWDFLQFTLLKLMVNMLLNTTVFIYFCLLIYFSVYQLKILS
jgi:hypothetical protein